MGVRPGEPEMSESSVDLALICSPAAFRKLSDEELMAKLCEGYGDALATLFERYSGQVFRIARSILKDDGEAEETVQRVFMDIYRATKQFNPDRGKFTTWLMQYAYHRSINRRAHLRANHFYTSGEINELALADFFEGAGHLLCSCSSPQEVACLVEQVLRSLDQRQRKVIELTYFEGLTAVEIAKKTGDSPSSVRNNLYRGLAKLRNVLLERKEAKTASDRSTAVQGMIVDYPRPL